MVHSLLMEAIRSDSKKNDSSENKEDKEGEKESKEKMRS